MVNIPLLRRLSVEAVYRKQITWGLILIAAGGLIGAAPDLGSFDKTRHQTADGISGMTRATIGSVIVSAGG